MKKTLIFLALLIAPAFVRTQSIYRAPDTAGPLGARITWARETARKENLRQGYWVGYTITKMMGDRDFIGTWNSDESRNKPDLNEELFDVHVSTMSDHDEASGDQVVHGTHISRGSREEDGPKSPKQVAIFFLYIADASSESLSRVDMRSMTLHFDFENHPVIWLGAASDSESIEFLVTMFNGGTDEVKKRALDAIGSHEPSTRAINFLKSVILSEAESDIRSQAAFWAGQLCSRRYDQTVVDLLRERGRSDRNTSVREQCIFAISEIHDERATEALIDLAKNDNDREVKEKAMFWLAQKASKKSVGAIEGIAYEDKDTEVEKQAVFALTQMPDHEATDQLIKIASTHPNPTVRKTAIFWLGQSKDPKAVDALIDIVKK
jgi:hypothetical protein